MMNKIKKYRDWKVGDDIYIKGKVTFISECNNYPVVAKPLNSNQDLGGGINFTKDGKWYDTDNLPSISFLPTEQSMPFDEVEIAVDTPVWVRVTEVNPWMYRFFAGFNGDEVLVWVDQKTSKDRGSRMPFSLYSFENPFDWV